MSKRKPINATMCKAIWLKHIGKTHGSKMLCGDIINGFDCEHVIAHPKGGPAISVSNLEPNNIFNQSYPFYINIIINIKTDTVNYNISIGTL
jgi:hypothetical protein